LETTFTILESPFGNVLVAWSDRGLERVGIGAAVDRHADPAWRFVRRLDCPATEQLRAYFAGTLREFDLPVVLGGTAFQKRVWQDLARIPYGQTASYGEISARIGSPNASRAVGLACGRNPAPIVIPCHRVIGSGGKLVGFGGGIAMKQALLDFERGRERAAQEALPLPAAAPPGGRARR
jgi:methylated-DNA-[protein]-cysteine S-methyltransferase